MVSELNLLGRVLCIFSHYICLSFPRLGLVDVLGASRSIVLVGFIFCEYSVSNTTRHERHTEPQVRRCMIIAKTS